MELNRTHLIGMGVVVALGLFAVATLWGRSSATGTIHVVGPRDEAVTIFVDGERRTAIARLEHHRMRLAQGPHEIRLVQLAGEERVHQIVVESGAYERLAPASGQCFVDLDVTDVHYTAIPPRPPVVTVVARAFGGEAFDVSRDHYFVERALPDRISLNERVYMAIEVPCDLASAPDADLVSAAGYGPAAPPRTMRRRM